MEINLTRPFKIAQKRLKTVLAVGGQFKIGETGQTISERVRDGVYRIDYNTAYEIYSSKNKLLIDALEVELIKYAKRYYPTRCNNKNAISYGRTTDRNAKYFIYVVIFHD